MITLEQFAFYKPINSVTFFINAVCDCGASSECIDSVCSFFYYTILAYHFPDSFVNHVSVLEKALVYLITALFIMLWTFSARFGSINKFTFVYNRLQNYQTSR